MAVIFANFHFSSLFWSGIQFQPDHFFHVHEISSPFQENLMNFHFSFWSPISRWSKNLKSVHGVISKSVFNYNVEHTNCTTVENLWSTKPHCKAGKKNLRFHYLWKKNFTSFTTHNPREFPFCSFSILWLVWESCKKKFPNTGLWFNFWSKNMVNYHTLTKNLSKLKI